MSDPSAAGYGQLLPGLDLPPPAYAAAPVQGSDAKAAATAANFAAAAAAVAGPSDDLLLDLLRRRYEARLQRDFPTSDVLREQLRGLGIYTDDRTKTWRSNSGRVGSLEGPDFLSPPGYGGSITPLHEGRSLTTEQIHDKLSQREQARMSKDFATADEIRRELNACGVSVDDNAKTWACNDGRSGPRPDAHGNLPPAAIAGVQAYTASYAQGHDGVREGRRERSRSPPRGDWLAPIAPPPEPMAGPLPRPSISTPTPAATLPPAAPRNDDARLIDLLRRRHEARQVRDYPTSDALRSELAALGVYTDDRAKTWRSRDGRTGSLEGPDYLAPIQPPPSAAGGYDSAAAAAYGSAATVRYMSIEEIHAQLTAREQARQSKDFSTADAIRRSLNACGISVCDRTKTWSSKDGRGGPRPDARGNIPAPDPYAASAPDSYGGQGGDPYAAQGSQDPGAGYYQQYGGYDYSTYYQQQGYQQQSQQGGYN